jgi:hypothetical protein
MRVPGATLIRVRQASFPLFNRGRPGVSETTRCGVGFARPAITEHEG